MVIRIPTIYRSADSWYARSGGFDNLFHQIKQQKTMSGVSIADVFGAKIRVSVPDRGLYLVIGRTESPTALVSSVKGQVVLQIPDRFGLLALISVSGFFALRRHPDILHIGPVTIQTERFNQFLAMVGLNGHHRENTEK
ncbi:MAG: hypothetical protein IPK19_29315 [Chloroflexi bacterium]|nr:hypothetical protein [Chloroflexota bacterium]